MFNSNLYSIGIEDLCFPNIINDLIIFANDIKEIVDVKLNPKLIYFLLNKISNFD